MKEIELTQGFKAIVDDEDYEYLSKWKWHYSNGYAVRHNSELYRTTGKRRLLPMHRLIANTPDEMLTDHANGNKLDNRKVNLRVCNPQQNSSNVVKPGTKRYRGVQKLGRKYRAKIKYNGEQIVIGSFDTEEEAALAYNEAAFVYQGNFAILNKVEVQEVNVDLSIYYEKQKYLEQFVRENIGMSEEEFSSVPMVDKRIFSFKVEFGEFANETAWFKYWKQSHQMNKESVIEELADCIHFLTAIGIYRNYFKYVKVIDYTGYEKWPEQMLYTEIMENPLRSSSLWKKCFEQLLAIGIQLGFSLEQIQLAYLLKNQKNIERQINKY